MSDLKKAFSILVFLMLLVSHSLSFAGEDKSTAISGKKGLVGNNPHVYENKNVESPDSNGDCKSGYKKISECKGVYPNGNTWSIKPCCSEEARAISLEPDISK